MRAPLAALALSFLFAPVTSDAASLRCGPELVSDGASKADVLLKCGEPLMKETRSEAVEEKVKQKGQGTTTTTERTVYKTIEEWTYNFGPRRLMQVAVFENGRLVDVHSEGYGR
jgi:Protein of unknown function (DUF2845)